MRDIRSIRVHNARVVPEAHDPTTFDIGREQISWPQDPVFSPSLFAVASQTVDENDAKKLVLQTVLELGGAILKLSLVRRVPD